MKSVSVSWHVNASTGMVVFEKPPPKGARVHITYTHPSGGVTVQVEVPTWLDALRDWARKMWAWL